MNTYQDNEDDQDFKELESLISNQQLRGPSQMLDQRILAIKYTAKRTRLWRFATMTTAAAACAIITVSINQNNTLESENTTDGQMFASAIQIQSQEVTTQTDHGIVNLGADQPQYRLINHETNRVIHIQDKNKNAKTKLEIKRQKQIYVPLQFD